MKIKDNPRLNELRERDREIRAREKERRAEIKERLQEVRFRGKEQMKRLKNFDYRTLRQRHLKKLTLLHSNVLEEYFANNPFIKLDGERRLLIHEP